MTANMRQEAVLITGASSGIGRASAVRLTRAGFRVFAGVRKEEDAARLSREGGGMLVPVELDVTREASILAARQTIEGTLAGQGLAGLVNNAGVGACAPLEYLRPEMLREVFEVNFFGQVAVIQTFLPLVREARGRIINIGSAGIHLALPFGSPLGASKAAFRSLNDTLRLELRPFGISVSMIEPGFIRTPAVEKTLGDAEGTIRALPPDGARRYGAVLREFMRRGEQQENAGSPPETVARVVLQALTQRRPRAHYPAGKGATAISTLARFAPDRVMDLLVRRFLGLGGPGRRTGHVSG